MKKSYVIPSVFVVATVLGTVSASWATDVGMPLYEGDIAGKKGSLEVYYEQYKRDAAMDRKMYNMENGQEISYDTTVYDQREEDRFIVRINYYAGSKIAFYAEAGALDSSYIYGLEGKEKVALFGAGLRGKIYSCRFFDASLFGSATYVPEIEYVGSVYSDEYGEESYFIEDSYSEINGGFTLSKFFRFDNTFSLLPYGGLMFSKLTGDGDLDFVLKKNDETRVSLIDATFRDDGEFSMFAGLGFMLNDCWAIRAEGRFVNQTSLSAGLTYFF